MTSAKHKNLLELRDVTIRFGGVTAVRNLSMDIPKDSIVGLIGPNGAGKTTVFNLITGFYRPNEGFIRFRERDITGLPPHRVCSKGISRTFQNIRLFSNESALENIMIGCHVRRKSKWWMMPLLIPSCLQEEKTIRETAWKLLSTMGLEQYANVPAVSLPYGAQRRLEIARALATEPSLLLLDEPAAGMNPQESTELMEFIRDIRKKYELTILLIEHDMKVVMGVCEYLWVLEYGQCIASGTPDEIQKNPKVIEAYLGEEVFDA